MDLEYLSTGHTLSVFNQYNCKAEIGPYFKDLIGFIGRF